ncbi:tRNA threonylcarbamoyl adenosine modification protein, SUA5/YciO/YrdC/YwlC family protein [Ceratobasidium sp. AG-Ba]|nr:tRNA threonylcarbamoyl adenosine modification protein, SUA5/YciO/YrdC/YwlC family protein [Ceratobasidium sp. AG-Ba]
MAKPTNVQVLQCNPASVAFNSPLTSTAIPTISDESTRKALQTASETLLRNEPVVFPTETVYGLAANALNPDAAKKIFSAKGRPADNPLISFWPGPMTLLFPANPKIVPSIITAGHPSVAARMPSHPIARALISLSRLPLAAPSANTSGLPSPTRAIHVEQDLGARGRVSLILDGGACDVGLESTVIDGLQPDGDIRILRPGGVTVEQIEAVVGPRTRVLVHKRDYADTELEHAPTTPGMKYRHYSPKVPVVLLVPRAATSPTDDALETVADVICTFVENLPSTTNVRKIGLLLLDDSPMRRATIDISVGAISFIYHSLGSSREPAQAGRNLFDGLISLEQAGVDVIFVEAVDETREGLAVMNRVRKAAVETHQVLV